MGNRPSDAPTMEQLHNRLRELKYDLSVASPEDIEPIEIQIQCQEEEIRIFHTRKCF